jgi:hypothetical protein
MARPKRSEYYGTLVKPIDVELIAPFGHGMGSPQFQEYLRERADKLMEARRAKFWELFNHFGLQLGPDFNPDNVKDMAQVWAALAMNLAVAHVPGFQEARPAKWSREIVMATLVFAEQQKAAATTRSDMPACLEMVRALDPEMARSGRKTIAAKRARTLRNKVSKLRTFLKREHRERQIAERAKSLH